jgi:photosystem II stability/assembly factor-like uncharacterized protein
MKHRMNVSVCIAFTLCLVGNAGAQHLTRITPPNITFRSISLADYSHSIVVGDSATIFICNTPADSGGFWWPLQSPCDRSHTFYGVSYYDTLHAAIVADAGLIFVTSDEGLTWKPSGAGITAQTLRAVTHTIKKTLIVVGDSGIILQSADSGKTWTKLNSSTAYNIKSISINARGNGYFVGDHGLIGRTSDYGATWSKVTDTITNLGANNDPINFRSVCVDDISGAMAVGDSGGFAKTSNGNVWTAFNWIVPGLSTADSANDAPTFAHTSYNSVLYYGTGVGFGDGKGYVTWQIYSDDDFNLSIGGATTQAQANHWHANGFFGDADGGTDVAIDRTKCEAIWRGAPYNIIHWAGPNEQIWTGADVSYIWKGVIEPALTIATDNFLFVSIDSLGKGFATAVEYYLKTTDNGFSWTENPNYPFLRATDIHTFDSNNAFAVGWAGSMFRTSDGGNTWDSTLIDPNQDRLHSIAEPAPNTFVVCGDYGTLLRSTDNAKTWQPSNIPSVAFLESVTFSTPRIGITAGTSGTILRTTDQGLTWKDVPNPLTGRTNVSFRQLAAFPSGTYYATTDSSGLFKSTDNGENWTAVTNVPQTMGLSFYNDRIGVVAEQGWCSKLAGLLNDTARFAFTTDGFASKPIEFNIPMITNNRMAFHFLDSTSFLCFASDAFVVKVDISPSGVKVTNMSPQTSPIQAYPNPSASHSTTLEYDLDRSGQTKIELLNELGERVETLFEGDEEIGHHSRKFEFRASLHGAFFIKVLAGTMTKTLPIIVE